MNKRVATAGSVQATVSTDGTANGAADSGTWSGGTITETTYPKLTAGGAVVHEATCTFSFTGTKGGNPVTVPPSTVTLSASGTPLQRGQSAVLVAGDKAQDTFGNTLEAKPSAGKLFTAKP